MTTMIVLCILEAIDHNARHHDPARLFPVQSLLLRFKISPAEGRGGPLSDMTVTRNEMHVRNGMSVSEAKRAYVSNPAGNQLISLHLDMSEVVVHGSSMRR
jgi:hypothetical protein